MLIRRNGWICIYSKFLFLQNHFCPLHQQCTICEKLIPARLECARKERGEKGQVLLTHYLSVPIGKGEPNVVTKLAWVLKKVCFMHPSF